MSEEKDEHNLNAHLEIQARWKVEKYWFEDLLRETLPKILTELIKKGVINLK